MDLHNTTIHGMALENANINFYQVNNFTKVHWVFKCTKCPAEMSSESSMMEHIGDWHPEALKNLEKSPSKTDEKQKSNLDIKGNIFGDNIFEHRTHANNGRS